MFGVGKEFANSSCKEGEDIMPKKKVITELRTLLERRGEISKAQREYAKVEEEAIVRMYPITRPGEEQRFQHLRTLERYIGGYAMKMLVEENDQVGVMQ